MISTSILHRLFVTRVGPIYGLTPEVTSCSLSLTDSLMNNWFVVQPLNRPERMGPLVQDLESVLKGTTSLLSLKACRSEFNLAPYVPSYSPSLTPEMGGLLSRRTHACFFMTMLDGLWELSIDCYNCKLLLENFSWENERLQLFTVCRPFLELKLPLWFKELTGCS